VNIIEALDDPKLLGAAIKDPATFFAWRTLLKGMFGLQLDDAEAELFRACTGRAELPTAAFAILWLVCGRRGGKSFVMALVAVFFAIFKDWRGGSQDSMTMGIAHCEGDAVILDLVAERRPPFSPDAVVAEFAEVLKAYRIATVRGDRYAGEWPRERFRAYGIDYLPADKSRSDIYIECLPRVTARRVELLDNRKLITQLASLERRTARSGKDSIDHPPNGHDDVANSACGAIVIAQPRPFQPVVVAPIFLGFAGAETLSPYADRRSEGFSRRTI
jgi:hypothetical protein